MPEKFHNEIDVDQEVARKVEEELKRWQREVGLVWKPPLLQSRKQYVMQPQQYLNLAQTYSQDVRVQMGEQVHTELLQPQQMKSGPQNYQPTRNANNHFIGEDTRNYQRGLQKQVENYNPDFPTTFDPQSYQPTIKVNNCFITETSRNYEGEGPQQYDRYPTSGLQAPRENLIN